MEGEWIGWSNQRNSDLNAMNDNGAITGMDAREDGVYITYVPTDGADPVTKKLGNDGYAGVEMYLSGGAHVTYSVSDYTQVSIHGEYGNAGNLASYLSLIGIQDSTETPLMSLKAPVSSTNPVNNSYDITDYDHIRVSVNANIFTGTVTCS